MNITSLQDILMHGDVTFHICAFLIIKSPKQSLGDLLFLLRFLLSLPKQSLGDLLFLLRFLLLLLLFLFFLSVHHELVHGRSLELQDRIS